MFEICPLFVFATFFPGKRSEAVLPYETQGADSSRCTLKSPHSSLSRPLRLMKLMVNADSIACGIFRQICALISLLFLEIHHKVFLRKSTIIRTQIFPESALADRTIVYLRSRNAIRLRCAKGRDPPLRKGSGQRREPLRSLK